MDVSVSDIIQLGAVAVIFVYFIAMFFRYIGGRRTDNQSTTANDKIIATLEKLGSNHLTHVQAAIEDGNRRIVDSQHNDNMRIIELLGEISGRLSK